MKFFVNKEKLNKLAIEKNINRDKISNKLLQFGLLEKSDMLKKLNTTAKGITNEEAEKRLEEYGYNEINHANENTWFKKIISAYINPFSVVLIVLAVVSFFTDYIIASPEDRSLKTVILLSAMVTVSGTLRFIQEGRSNKAGERLKAMIKTTTMVLRNGVANEISLSELVPGDVVHLAAGDMIPADVRVIYAKDLFVSQSSMTGESEPVEKHGELHNATKDKNISSHLDLENLAYMGTNVISGTATAIVISTGNDTCLGTMADSITEKRESTSFDKGVNSVSWVLIRFMACMVPVVFIINGVTKGDWLEAFLFALSVAVGLTPEMLPMIVTTNLAKGAVRMSKQKTIVKNLNSIQNFGAMDVLCTDKTGTLTEDKIILERHLDIHGKEDIRVLRHGYLNSYFQTGLKNLLDVAILEHGDEEGFQI